MKEKDAEEDSKIRHNLCVGIQGRGMEFLLKSMILKYRENGIKLVFINDIRNEYRKEVRSENQS